MSYIEKEPTRRTVLIARKGYQDTGSVWDKIKTAFTTSADIYHQYKAGEQPAQPVMVESGTPGWVLPVALIGGGLVLFYIIKKRSV